MKAYVRIALFPFRRIQGAPPDVIDATKAGWKILRDGDTVTITDPHGAEWEVPWGSVAWSAVTLPKRSITTVNTKAPTLAEAMRDQPTPSAMPKRTPVAPFKPNPKKLARGPSTASARPGPRPSASARRPAQPTGAPLTVEDPDPEEKTA